MDDAERSMAKAERLAVQASKLGPEDFETVIHAGYYAMFHAARAALFAIEGGASTRHGRVSKAFADVAVRVAGEEGAEHARALRRTYDLRIQADYGPGGRDLAREARMVVLQMQGVLAFCRSLMEKDRQA